MPRPIHFEIPADNPTAPSHFISRHSAGNSEMGESATVLVDRNRVKRYAWNRRWDDARRAPGESTVNTIEVTSLDDAIGAVTKHGGKMTVPKMPIGRIGCWRMHGH